MLKSQTREGKTLISNLKKELMKKFGSSNENKINSQLLALTLNLKGLNFKVSHFRFYDFL